MRLSPHAHCVIAVLGALVLGVPAAYRPSVQQARERPPPQPDAGRRVGRAGPAAARPSAVAPLARLAPRAVRAPSPLSPVAAFTDWLTALRRGAPLDHAEGLRLAAARRTALKQLIMTDPPAALASAVPRGVRAALPPDISALLEAPVDATARFDVVSVCFGADDRIERSVTIDGRRYQAHVYGRRLATLSKAALPVHGIAIDDQLAVSEHPYRRLEVSEQSRAGILPPVLAVAVGGGTRTFDSEGELSAWAERVAVAEAAPDPDALLHPAAAADTANWVFGDKTVLWLKVEFPDDPGAPVSDQAIVASMAEAKAYYDEVSRGRTGFTTIVLPQAIVLPQPKSYYAAQGYAAISDDALAAARTYDAAHGNGGTYSPDHCDRWIVVFKNVPAYGASGLGSIGAKGLWLNGTADSYTVAHELGHNQGLLHSHAWVSKSASPISPGNGHVEYGDVYDLMGVGQPPAGHFNAPQKEKLGYLADTEIAAVTQPGVYRIHRTDDRAAAGVQALQINAGSAYDYWVEFRQRDPGLGYDRDRLRQGVLVHWGRHPSFAPGDGTYLLDMTPGSVSGMNDAPLAAGEKFVDPDYGITITPGATGGSAPAQWIDVRVDFGATGDNHNPTLALGEVPATLAARTSVPLTATATDPDRDPVSYRWDFGDGDTSTSGATVTHCWLTGGAYTVSCTVTDGRGGIDTRTTPMVVEDPLLTWTNRAPDSQCGLHGVVYGGGQFVAVGSFGTVMVSPDGIAWNEGSGLWDHCYNAIAWSGTTYVAVGLQSRGTNWGAAIAESDDGVNWRDVTPAGVQELLSVTFGAGRFVAVGRNGETVTSTDGVTWSAAASNANCDLYAVTYAGGRYVAVGASGCVTTSTDAATWSNRSVPSFQVFRGVVWRAGQWLVSSGQETWTSSDGMTWTAVPGVSGGEYLNALFTSKLGNAVIGAAWGGRVYVSDAGTVWRRMYSDDGPDAGMLWSAAEGNGVVVAVGDRAILQSGTPRLHALALPAMVTVGRQTSTRVATDGFAKLELLVDGAVVSKADGPTGVLSWTPFQFGVYTLVVRGTAADGSTESVRQRLSAGLENWTWENPPLGANALRFATYGLGKWWVADNVGALFTSANGKKWIGARTPFAAHGIISAIVGTDTRVVLAGHTDGANPGLWTTTDGATWNAVSGLGTDQIVSLAFGAGQWTAMGVTHSYTSADGVTWTAHPLSPAADSRAMAYGDGHWVAVGRTVITSTDAITWTAASTDLRSNDYLEGVAYVNGHWVAIGYSGRILTSSDALVWTSVDPHVGGGFLAIGVWSGQFVVTGSGGTVLTSADGQSWVNQPHSRNAFMHALAVHGDEILVVGDGAEIEFGTAPQSLQSLDSQPRVTAYGLVADGNGVFMATMNFDPAAAIWTAPVAEFRRGERWRVPRFDSEPYAQASAIARFGGQLVAVCLGGEIFTSADGTQWTARQSGVATGLCAVGASTGAAVAVGLSGVIVSSTDGVNWAVRASGVSDTLRGIAYGNGSFIAVGDNGTVLQSSDGTRWSRQSTGTAQNLFAVTWSPATGFVVVGVGDSILRSPDGASWTRIPAPNGWGYTTLAVTPFGLIAGSMSATASVSADGQHWMPVMMPLASANALGADAQNLWAAGDNGALVRHAMTIAPIFEAHPTRQSATWGDSVTLSAAATGAGTLTYQWYLDDKPVEGATRAQYAMTWVTPADAGVYRVVATDVNGVSATSDAVAVTVGGAAPWASRLANLSVRANLREGEPLIVGFSASDTRPVLVRAVGPTLAGFGVPTPCANPAIELYAGGAVFAANDDWDPALAGAFDRLGAFPLRPGSQDAALVRNITGPVSAFVRAPRDGTVLVELYDAGRGYRPKLVNVSARGRVGAADDVLIAGFVVDASATARLLIRGVGPQLRAYGIAAPLPDPLIEVRNQARVVIATNDDWSSDATTIVPLQAALRATNAFGLDGGSKDAALLVDLPSGLYTVQLSDAHGGTGEGLIEVYEVP